MDQDGPLFLLEMMKGKIPEESKGSLEAKKFGGKELEQHALTLHGHTPKVGLHYYAHVCGKV
jgi:hypothetical protein